MNKDQLAARVTTEPSTSKAGAHIDASTEPSAIADALARGESAATIRFGTPSRMSCPACQRRNHWADKYITIANLNTPLFEPSRTLRDAVT